MFSSLTKHVELTAFKVSTFQFIPLSLEDRGGVGANTVQVDKYSRGSCTYPKLQLLFCASIITRKKWRYIVILYFPTTMILIALGTELFWMLLPWISTATEAEIRILIVVHDTFVRTGRLTSPAEGSLVTVVVVKCAHDHSVLCSLAFLSIYRNLCVTVAEISLGTNPSTILLVSGVFGHHFVIIVTRSS